METHPHHRAEEQERRTRYTARYAAERIEYDGEPYRRVRSLLDWPLEKGNGGETVSPPLWADLLENDHGRQVVMLGGDWDSRVAFDSQEGMHLPQVFEGQKAEQLKELLYWLPNRPTLENDIWHSAPAENRLYSFLNTQLIDPEEAAPLAAHPRIKP